MCNKIAYIVQAHKNAKQINLLIENLLDDNVDVYLHIDKKSVGVRENIVKRQNVYLLDIDESIDVRWGDISQVKATVALLKKVFDLGLEYKFIYLISGQCFPIKTKAERKAFFDKADKNDCFIDCYQSKVLDKRNDVKYPSAIIKNTFFAKVIKRLYMYVTGGRAHTFKLFKRKRPVEVFYHGSSWWCMSYDAIKSIYDKLTNESIWLEYFSKSVCADECVFQTLFMNFCKNAKVCKMPTYVDWSEGNRNPKLLTIQDKDVLIKTEHLFARKFDICVDAEIVKQFCVD